MKYLKYFLFLFNVFNYKGTKYYKIILLIILTIKIHNILAGSGKRICFEETSWYSFCYYDHNSCC